MLAQLTDDLLRELYPSMDSNSRAQAIREHRQFIERYVVESFAETLERRDAIKLDDVRSVEHDPPDCTASMDGRQVTIEVTELVLSTILEKARYILKNEKRTTSELVEHFDDAQWTKEFFETSLNRLIDSKHEKYSKRSPARYFDVLLIYTDAGGLTLDDVKAWLPEIHFEHRPSFGCVYFTVSYRPECGGWPAFRLLGNLT